MNPYSQDDRSYTFVLGMLAGTAVGVGLTMWLAPRASVFGERITDSARRLGDRASDQYQQASARVGDAVDEFTQRAQSLRDDVADRVARGAHEVERVATAAKSNHPEIDRSTVPAPSL